MGCCCTGRNFFVMTSRILERAMAIAFNRAEKDFELTVFVTNRCNASCEHCFYNSQLSHEPAEFLIENFQKLAETIPDNCVKITLAGGEPFLREDLLEIVSVFAEKGIKKFLIVTNGFLTDAISRFVDSIVHFNEVRVEIVVSLDGPQEIHDKVRGCSGAFSKGFKTLMMLKEKNADFGVQTVISRSNYRAIKSFDQFILDELGIRVHYQFIRGDEISGLPDHLKASFNPKDENLLPSLDEMKEFLNVLRGVYEQRIIGKNGFLNSVFNFSELESKYVIFKKRKKIFSCLAGKSRAVVFPTGEVAICEYIKPESLKLQDCSYNFNDLWNSSDVRKKRQIAERCYCTQGCFIKTAGTLRFSMYFIKNIFRFLCVYLRKN